MRRMIREEEGRLGFFDDREPITQPSGDIGNALVDLGLMESVTPLYGEIFAKTNTDATAIDVANAVHAVIIGATGLVNGFTFQAGLAGTIASVAEGTEGDGIVTITDNAHGLLTGEIITIEGSTDYDGVYVVTKLTANTFTIAATWTQTRTGTWYRGANLKANVLSAGKYLVAYNAVIQSAGSSKAYEFELYQNITPNTGSASKLTMSAADVIMTGKCIMDIADGDIIWLGLTGATDTTDATILDLNVTVTPL